jgi:hypothetical protein
MEGMAAKNPITCSVCKKVMGTQGFSMHLYKTHTELSREERHKVYEKSREDCGYKANPYGKISPAKKAFEKRKAELQRIALQNKEDELRVK